MGAKPKKNGSISYAKWGYIFIAPFFLIFAVFQLIPLGSTIYYSFFEYYRSGLKIIGPTFVGLKNYITLFATDLPKYFGNTLLLWIIGFIPQIAISLLLAAWFTDLRLKLKGQTFFKTVIYMPNLIMASAFAMLFFALFSDNGPVNAALVGMGILKEPFSFLNSVWGNRGLIGLMNFLMWFGNTTIMLMAAIAGYMATVETGSFAVGFIAAVAVGILFALFFAIFAVGLRANQQASGLGVAIFGGGLSAYIGIPYQGAVLPERAADGIPFLDQIPFLGQAFFSQHWIVYLSLLMIPAVWYFLFRTRPGLVVRAVGESPFSANALGYSVPMIRCATLAFSGACIGLSGAYLSLIYTPLWVEGMIAGRGWIALALVTFGTWRPFRVFLGAYLFGGMTMLQMNLQSIGISVPTQFISMAPYAATIIVLALISRNPTWIRLNMPASLGKPFNPH